MLCLALFTKAQCENGYGYCFASSSVDKTLYITKKLKLSKYTGNGFLKRYITLEFNKTLTIEVGSSLKNYTSYIILYKSAKKPYSNDQGRNVCFTSKKEVNGAIKDVIATYKAKGYRFYKLSL